MTHYTINYANSPSPQFDAVEDIKDYLGVERYNLVSPEMAKLTNCAQFALYCSLAGINGLPVKAWYESFHGQGSWKPSHHIFHWLLWKAMKGIKL